MRITHTIANLTLSSGGPARSVPALAAACGMLNTEVGITTFGERPTYEPQGVAILHSDGSRKKFEHLVRNQIALVNDVVLHDHGVWLLNNRLVAKYSKTCGCALVISPRGMLEPWALNHKKWKKRLAWSLYQKFILENASCLHTTSVAEAEQIRKLGLRNPIAVVPNGIEIPELNTNWQMRDGRTEYDIYSKKKKEYEKRTILFLSRIQKKKGLVNLVKAWAKVKDPGWSIRVIGPEEDGHLAEVKSLAENCGVIEDFTFEEPIDGDLKWTVYRNADLFVLPTFSENFGIVIAEALACGTPVITTKGAPWEELNTHRCGWWIDIGVQPLADALKDAMSRSDSERVIMGLRGRKLVEDRYAWPRIAEQMIEVYASVLYGGKVPDCVWLD